MSNLPEENVIHPKYRPDIDGLRALAILSVVGFHAFGVIGGFAGVDIFFVISGYLISTIIFEGIEDKRFSFVDFYARRIRRIFLALALVLIAVLVGGYFLFVDDEYMEIGRHTAAGAGFVSNLVLWSESGYFKTESELKPLLHLWSLGIEEQFYIFWPLIIWMCWSSRLRLLAVTTLLLAASFIFNAYQINIDSVGTFYSPLTRFWELLIGSSLAALTFQDAKRRTIFARHENLLSFLGGVLIILSLFILDKTKPFPGWWAVLPTVGAALVIFCSQKAFFNRLLSSRVLVWFGLISFPLYLWHWPLLGFLRVLGGDRPSTSQRIIAVLIAIVLAWLTYRFIERPIRKKFTSRKVAGYLLLLVTLIGLIGFAIYKLEGLQFRPASAYSVNNKALDKTLKYFHFNNGVDRVSAGCKKIIGNNQSEIYCQLSSENPKILIVGDSHAISFAYSQVLSKNPQVGVIAGNGCLPVFGFVGVRGDEVFSNRKDVCQRLMMDAEKIAKTTPSIKYVVFVNGGTRYLGQNFKFIDLSSNSPISSEAAYYEGFINTIKLFQKLDKQVVLTIDAPSIGKKPEDCVKIRPYSIGEHKLLECTMSKNDFNSERVEYLNIFSKIISNTSGVLEFDPTSLFCDDIKCYGIKGDKFYYFDGEHLGAPGSELIFNSFNNWLKSQY
jgi:peptidoglycan/LPS O-acetylase OafA/YrhL